MVEVEAEAVAERAGASLRTVERVLLGWAVRGAVKARVEAVLRAVGIRFPLVSPAGKS